MNQLEYNSLISAIPIEWKKMIKQIRPSVHDASELLINKIIETHNVSKLIYEMLIENKSTLIKVSTKLRKKFDIGFEEQEIHNAFKVRIFTKIDKYVSFQYRLLHCAILLNDRLFHMGMVREQIRTFLWKTQGNISALLL